MLDPITFTITPSGQDCSLTINLTELLERLQTVPDQRKRRGVRYPLAHCLQVKVSTRLSRAESGFFGRILGHFSAMHPSRRPACALADQGHCHDPARYRVKRGRSPLEKCDLTKSQNA